VITHLKVYIKPLGGDIILFVREKDIKNECYHIAYKGHKILILNKDLSQEKKRKIKADMREASTCKKQVPATTN